MFHLILVSLIWAFSFGLIRVFGSIDPILLAFLRLTMAAALFLPFLKSRNLNWSLRSKLLGIGAIQYGAMYALLFSSYQFVGPRSHLIALFTITTPIFILLFAAILEKRISTRAWLAGLLAVIGAMVIQWNSDLGNNFWIAFLLLQGSNATFAFGQIAYRRLRQQIDSSTADHHIFAWIFIGATLLTGCLSLFQGNWQSITTLDSNQWLALCYLGLIASGLAFFWWNLGATRVTPPTLAVMNNLKIPLAILVSLLIFQEWKSVAWPQFLMGSLLISSALLLCRTPAPPPEDPA